MAALLNRTDALHLAYSDADLVRPTRQFEPEMCMNRKIGSGMVAAMCACALGGAGVASAAALDCSDAAAFKAADSAYRDALIEHHAGRADARSQLIGGLLLATQVASERWEANTGSDGGPIMRPVGARTPDPRSGRAIRMLDNAALGAPEDVLVHWLIATLDVVGIPEEAATDAARRLTELDPGNIAGWLLRYSREGDTLDDAGRSALLQHAAAGTRHEVFHTEILRLGQQATRALPPPSALVHCVGEEIPSVPLEEVYGLGIGLLLSATISPGHTSASPCRDSSLAHDRMACLAIARTMALHAEEQLGESVGASLWTQLAGDDAAERAAALKASHAIEWRREQQGALMQDLDPVAGLAWEVTGSLWATPGVSERDIQHAMLASAGVPLQAPDDFVPARERAVEAARRRQARQLVGWQTRSELESRYHARLSAQHAASDDPRRLLVALLHADHEAFVAHVKRQPDAGDSHETTADLARHVLDAADDDAMVLWALVERLRGTREAVSDAALVRLLAVDADNAAAWLLALQQRGSTLDAGEREAMLERAAGAKGFRVYALALARSVADAIDAVPPSQELLAHWREDTPGLPDEGFAWVQGIGFSSAVAVPMPPRECAAATRGESSVRVRELCRDLARVLATASDSETGERLGLRLWRATAASPDDAAAADKAWRDHSWRSERWRELNEQAFADGGDALQWDLLGPHWQQPEATEASVVRAVLQSAGVPLEAPPAYVPLGERVRRGSVPDGDGEAAAPASAL